MSFKSTLSLTSLSLLLLASPALTRADSIAVANSDFSIVGSPLSIPCGSGCAYNNGPVPDWTYSGPGGAGSWQPNSTYYTSLPAGETTVAFINGGELSQDLGTLLTPDTTYALSVAVGNRIDNLTTNYGFGLDAGGTELAYWSNNGLITPGSFELETISFTTGSVVNPGDLSIFLSDSGPQADFGDVSLTAVPTPEPSTLALLAIGLAVMLFVGWRHKNHFQLSN